MKFDQILGLDYVKKLYEDLELHFQQQTLKGHTKSVKSVKLSYDESKLYSISNDNTVKLWDIKQKYLVAEYKMQSSKVTCISNNDFLKDKLFVGYEDGKIKQFSTENLNSEAELEFNEHSLKIYDIEINFQGTKLYSVSQDKSIIIWDISSTLVIKKIDYYLDSLITGICLNDSKKVFYSKQKNEKIIRTWDMQNIQELETQIFEGHSNDILALTFNQNFQQIFSTSNDKTIRVWDVNTCQEIKSLRMIDINHIINTFDIQKSGTRLFLGTSYGDIVVWENQIRRKAILSLKIPNQFLINSCQENNQIIVSSDINGNLTFIRSDTQQINQWKNIYKKNIKFLDKIRCKKLLVILDHGIVILFQIDIDSFNNNNFITIQEKFQLNHFQHIERCFFFHKTDKHYDIIISNQDGKIYKIRLYIEKNKKKQSKNLAFLGIHNDLCTSIDLSKQQNRLITGSLDETIKFWDINNKKEISKNRIEGYGFQFTVLIYDDEIHRIYSASKTENSIKVWDINNGKQIKSLTLKGHKKPITCMALCNKRRIYSGSKDFTIRVWDPRTAHEIKELRLVQNSIIRQIFICWDYTDQYQTLIALDDYKIRIWSLQNEQNFENQRYFWTIKKLLLKNHPKKNNHQKIAYQFIIYMKNHFHSLKILSKVALFLCQLKQPEIIIDYLQQLGYNHFNYDLIEEILKLFQRIQIEKKKNRKLIKKFYTFKTNESINIKQNRLQLFVKNQNDLQKNLKKSLREILFYLKNNLDQQTYISTQGMKQLLFNSHQSLLVSDVMCLYLCKKINETVNKEIKPSEFPILKLNSEFDINQNDFQKLFDDLPTENQIITYEVYHTKFSMDLSNGSDYSLQLFKLLAQSNETIQLQFEPIVEYKWQQIRTVGIIWAILYFILAISFNLVLYSNQPFMVFQLVIFIIFILFLLEIKTMTYDISMYICDVYNFFDMLLLICSLVTIFYNYSISSTEDFFDYKILAYFSLFTSILINFRAFMEMRIFPVLTYLIATILNVYKKILPFLFLMVVFIYTYATMLVGLDFIKNSSKVADEEILRSKSRYVEKLIIAINQGLGSYDTDDQKQWNFLEWIVFIFNATTLSVILLNIVIAIISDIFSKFKEDQKVVLIQQKIDQILNLDSLLYIPKSWQTIIKKTDNYSSFQFLIKKQSKSNIESFLQEDQSQKSDNFQNAIDELRQELDTKLDKILCKITQQEQEQNQIIQRRLTDIYIGLEGNQINSQKSIDRLKWQPKRKYYEI